AKHASHALDVRPEELSHVAGEWTVDLPWPQSPEPDLPWRPPDRKGGDAQLDQAGIGIGHDLLHLGPRRVERRASVAGLQTELEREPEHLASAAVREMAAVRVVVDRAGGGVAHGAARAAQRHRLDGGIRLP